MTVPTPTGNPAFDAARAQGVIDAFLAMPSERSEQVRKYDNIRELAMDAETQSMEMPAEYMFKQVPHYDDLPDPVAEVLRLMDTHGIATMLGHVDGDECRLRPDRFRGLFHVDPNQGMDAVRALHAAVTERGAVAAHTWGTGMNPQVPINDKKMYPLYAKCVELDVPMVLYVGVPGPRILMSSQEVAQLDEVCWFFPELRIVTRHGGEPWQDLMVKLLLKWPNLYYSTSAFAPKHYPKAIIDYANTRGADKILYAGYYAAGLSLDRIFDELPGVPFRDHVWPKFLHENARKVFKLDD
jgi:hypothetical protein